MGGIDFVWLTVWILSADWISRKLGESDIFQALKWSCRPWGSAVHVPTFYRTTFHLPYKWGKSWKTSVMVTEKALGWLASNAIRLVTCDGLHCLSCSCRPSVSRHAIRSILSLRKYLPSCRTRWFATSRNFESKLKVRALMWRLQNAQNVSQL